MVIFPCKYIQNLRTSQGYIFLILQQFATKLCNFTHFKMLFPAMVYNGFLSSCLDQNFVYTWNHPLMVNGCKFFCFDNSAKFIEHLMNVCAICAVIIDVLSIEYQSNA
jgi:uncharacterized protein YbcV (DUF1398 family)